MGEVAIIGMFQIFQISSSINTEELCCFHSNILFSVPVSVCSVGPIDKLLTSEAFGGKVLTSFDSSF